MDKKRLEYYKKKLETKREDLLKSIARTEEAVSRALTTRSHRGSRR